MDVLRYKTDDYEVIVRTDNISYSWQNFKGRIKYRNQVLDDKSNPEEYCVYTAKDAVKFSIYNPDDENAAPKESDIRNAYWPVIYETNKYQICIKFYKIDAGSKPRVVHILKEVENAFFLDEDGDDKTKARLTGDVDFLNQPGLFKLNFEYQKGGQKRDSYIAFDVVSPKLDTKHDYKKILKDVDQEFNGLVFNYLSTTFQQFSKGKINSLEIWMQVFQQVVREYLKNVDRIIRNPYSRVRTIGLFSKADSIKRWTPAMEEEYKENECAGKLEEHYFEYYQYVNTVNSLENRFVKYTLEQIGGRLQQVFSKLLAKGNQIISLTYIREWEEYQHKIHKYQKHPFFKAVGKFEGLSQESLVLQSRMGYQQVYKDWLRLKKGIDFYNGATNIGTLQIWEIYELWCFLKVKNMIRQLMGFDSGKSDSVYDDLIDEPNGNLINYSVDKKTDYRVVFKFPSPDDERLAPDFRFKDLLKKHQGEEVSLHYQHTFNRRREDDFNLQTVTTEQRPDIVLNIKKSDGFVLTYLYDAKYRVWGDKNLDKDFENLDQEEQKEFLDAENRELTFDEQKQYGADYPPSDAINQMHRYRDAIYYGLQKDRRPDSKEIIGGYILFPGRGDDKHIKERYFHKSIATVNIGAFPLLPMQGGVGEDGKDLEGPQLWEHLKNILLEKDFVYSHVGSSVPQRGLQYQEGGNLSGVALIMMENFENRKNSFLNGKIAIPIKLTESCLTLLENQKDISYVLFHVRKNDKNKHLFRVEGIVRVVSKDDAESQGYYLVQQTANKYICVDIDLSKELDSSSLNPSVYIVPYDSDSERYDSQYATMKQLQQDEI